MEQKEITEKCDIYMKHPCEHYDYIGEVPRNKESLKICFYEDEPYLDRYGAQNKFHGTRY